MDRQIVYPGAIPLETDLLNTNKYAMMGLAKLAAALMGSNTYMHGLACTPSSPASMVVNVAKGQIYSLQNVDGTAYSSLAADTTNAILKQGVTLSSTTFTLTAPTTAGQSINYLIQVAYSDTDSGATVLPYYNAANPSVAYSGPNNAGTAQNTVRSGVCTVALKAGVSATTGTQTTPSADTGYTAAWVITVAQGASTVTASNISLYPNAPFIPSAGIFDSIQRNLLRYGNDSGAANAYVVNITPGISSLSSGMEIIFKALSANTGASTLNVCALGAFPILNKFGAALTASEIVSGSIVRVLWVSSASAWFLCEATSGLPTTPTAAAITNSTQTASAAFVHQATTGLISSSRNMLMSIPSSAATGTLTADEIVVGTGLGGSFWKVYNYSATINLASTGAGGMDTGSAPSAGFVALYAIFNAATGVASVIAVNVTSSVAPEVYGGANMPSGYTASALIAVWRLSNSQFTVGLLKGRKVSFPLTSIFSSSTLTSGSYTAFSANSIIPLGAKKLDGAISTNGIGSINAFISPDSSGSGARWHSNTVTGSTALSSSSSFSEMPITTSANLYYALSSTNSATITLYANGYEV
ncbi:phage tail protein [Pantoea vagans]|uniref:phage tail protein n=1 Tax=Pantoea vagans TaxID=470934 RepID=UPI000A5E5394|nr:phage tail protein [Pantoea vagans]